MDKRKIYFWIIYVACFAVLFLGIRTVFYSFVPDTKWMDAIFVVLLFIIASPISTIVSTTLLNRIIGPEEK